MLKRWVVFVSVYMLIFGLSNTTLELYNLYFFQKHRAYLSFVEVSFGLRFVSTLLAASGWGFVVGLLVGSVDYRLLQHRSGWVGAMWFVARTLLLLLVFVFHWLNAIFFDVTQVYLSRPPTSLVNVFQSNVHVIYDRTMRNSVDILFQYYSPVHLFLFVVLIIASYYARLLLSVDTDVVAQRFALCQRMFVAVFACVVLAVAIPLLQTTERRQALCFGTVFSMWNNPGCRFSLPEAPNAPNAPEVASFVNNFRTYLKNWKERTQSAAEFARGRAGLASLPQPSAHRSTKATTKPTSATQPTKAEPLKPHIVLLLMESVAARHVGVYGYRKHNTTPFLDRYAKKCRRYKWAFANSNISSYGISALFGSRVGEHVIKPRKLPIFPELLTKAGYRNGLFVPGYRHDRIDQYMNVGDWSRYFDMYSASSYRLTVKHPCHLDCHSVKEFSSWWRKNESKGPLFASLTMYSTHFPYHLPPGWTSKFAKEKVRFYSPVYFHRDELPGVIAHYDSAIYFVDFLQSQIIDFLEKRKSKRPIYFIITSDHGEDLYKHGDASHGTNLFNSQIRVPLLLCGPKIKAGISQEKVSLVDLGPTVLRMAGLPLQPHFEGHDLLSPSPYQRPIFLYNEMIRHEIAVIMGDYKMIRSFSRKTEELYNLRTDPGEKHNILQQHSLIAQSLRWILLRYWQEKNKLKSTY